MALPDHVQQLAADFCALSMEVTDTSLPALPAPGSKPPASAAEFHRLVSLLYKWFQEGISPDLAFLSGQVAASGSSQLWSFRSSLNALRQDEQHLEHHPDVASWYRQACGTPAPSSPENWTHCGTRLLREAQGALTVVMDMAEQARSDPLTATRWRQNAAARQLDLDAALASALALIRRSPPVGQTEYLTRQLRPAWDFVSRSRGAREDAESLLEAVAAKTVTAWAMQPLPCSPAALASEIEPANAADTLAILLLAHAIQAHGTDATDEQFIEVVHEAWRRISS